MAERGGVGKEGVVGSRVIVEVGGGGISCAFGLNLWWFVYVYTCV